MSSPLVHTCDDFAGEFGVCCNDCHQHGDVIRVYPESVHSIGFKDKMPDLSMGIHAEICCRLYDQIKRLSREWWVELYGRKHGYRLEHIKTLVEAASDPRRFLQVCGEVGSIYWNQRNAGVGVGRAQSDTSRTVGVRSATRGKPTVSKCPACGARSFVEVCDNCGHGGGL